MFNNNTVIPLKVYSTWECAEYGKYYLWFTDDDAQIKNNLPENMNALILNEYNCAL